MKLGAKKAHSYTTSRYHHMIVNIYENTRLLWSLPLYSLMSWGEEGSGRQAAHRLLGNKGRGTGLGYVVCSLLQRGKGGGGGGGGAGG